MASRPLIIAIAAMVLLIASVTFEVTFHRTYYVDIHDADGWQNIGQFGNANANDNGFARAPAGQSRIVTVDRNGSADFRVRVDNGYPWSYSHHYDVTVNGLNVASGDISARGRDTGESAFAVKGSTLLANLNNVPAKDVAGSNMTTAYIEVQLGNVYLSGSAQLQEAGR